MFLVIALPASVASASWDGNDDVFKGHRVAGNEMLENMRGGFVGFAGGQRLELSFGINHAVFVNGQLLVTTQLTIPSILRPADAHVETVSTILPNTSLAPQVTQTNITTLQTQSGQVNIVQIGPGNTVSLSPTQLPSGVMNIIQNTLHNQTIKQTTGISVNVNSLGLLRAMNFGSAIQRAVLRSIR